MKRSLPLVLAAILLIVADTVEARHSVNGSRASGGRAAASAAAPAGNAKSAISQDHGGTAQSRAPGTPTPSSGAKNFGAHVPTSALGQGRASASSLQPAASHQGASGITAAPGQAPTGLASQAPMIAVPTCPTGQAMSPAPNGCMAPSQHPHRHFCGPWCYDRGLGYGMNPYEIKEDCEKLKDNPKAYQNCLSRKAQYSHGPPDDRSRG
jgi:hypothetical protein